MCVEKTRSGVCPAVFRRKHSSARPRPALSVRLRHRSLLHRPATRSQEIRKKIAHPALVIGRGFNFAELFG